VRDFDHGRAASELVELVHDVVVVLGVGHREVFLDQALGVLEHRVDVHFRVAEHEVELRQLGQPVQILLRHIGRVLEVLPVDVIVGDLLVLALVRPLALLQPIQLLHDRIVHFVLEIGRVCDLIQKWLFNGGHQVLFEGLEFLLEVGLGLVLLVVEFSPEILELVADVVRGDLAFELACLQHLVQQCVVPVRLDHQLVEPLRQDGGFLVQDGYLLVLRGHRHVEST